MNASIHNITTVIWGPVPDPFKDPSSRAKKHMSRIANN